MMLFCSLATVACHTSQLPRIIRVARAMSKRKSYDVSFKLKAVEYAEKTTKKAAAREMGVGTKRIREWCKQKEVLVSLKKKGTHSHRLFSWIG